MYVGIIQATMDPVDIISKAAGKSTDKSNNSVKRVNTCVEREHFSVLEHAFVTFEISGVSIALMRQLLRHRMASPTEKSLRYVEVTSEKFCPILPPDIEENDDALYIYDQAMCHVMQAYSQLIDLGIKREDARMVLPLATTTSVMFTCNFREFLHILKERLSKGAQWEIRELVALMYSAIHKYYKLEQDSSYIEDNFFDLPAVMNLLRSYDETGILSGYHTYSQE